MEKEFKIPRNIVPLPSKGKLYPDNIDYLEIEYMTAYDEDLLASPSLLSTGKAIDMLLERKIVDKKIKPSDLLLGDKNRILLQLRADSYGQYYTVNVTCPYTGNTFEYHVDLVKLKIHELEVEPNEKMLFKYELPISKDIIYFKLLTSADMDSVLDKVQSNKKTIGIETNITSVLKACIKQINDIDDLSKISNYVDIMKAGDSLHLRNYIEKISPKVDNTVEIVSPYNDKKFTAKISFGADFFYPSI